MMKRIRAHFLLILILLISGVVRFVGLNKAPPSLYWEEVALGYDAYSILQTGKDFHGNPYPIVAFASFGDYKPSLYIYLIAPFISVFGLNEWSVRLPSALAGMITVLFVYLIGRRWDRTLGLWSAFLFAIQPWSIQISRTGFETNVATALMTAGMWFGLQAIRKRRYAIFTVLCLSLAMYTYHAARIVAPLLGISLGLFWFLSWQERFLKIFWQLCLMGLLAIVLVSPILRSLNSPEVRKRADETSLFAGTVLAEKSNAQIQAAGGTRFAKLLHHRYGVGAKMLIAQYIRNFDPNFIFMKGDGNPRHSTGLVGLVYPWEIITITLGLIVICKFRKKEYVLLIWWLVVSGIPASVTTVSPHALRFLSAAPVLSLISGLGITFLVNNLRQKKMMSVIIILLGVASVLYFSQYFWTEHRLKFSESYQYGYKELYAFLESEKTVDDRIAVTRQEGRPSMYYLFFTKQNPRQIQKVDSQVPKDQQELLRVGQYDFVDGLDISKYTLFATAPRDVPVSVRILKEIRRLDNSTAWIIWRKS